jgi:two-component system CheB/CheR fusion protein
MPKLRESLEDLNAANNQFHGLEIRHNFRGLGEKVILVNARKVFQKMHKQKLILLAIEDITEHREGQKIIAERVAWFQNMADNAPVMLWVAGRDKFQTFLNKTWLEFTGTNMEEELGMGWTRNIHPEDIADFLKIYNLSFEQQIPFRHEYRLRRKDGIFRQMIVMAKPTFSPDQKFTGFIGTVIDKEVRG